MIMINLWEKEILCTLGLLNKHYILMVSQMGWVEEHYIPIEGMTTTDEVSCMGAAVGGVVVENITYRVRRSIKDDENI